MVNWSLSRLWIWDRESLDGSLAIPLGWWRNLPRGHHPTFLPGVPWCLHGVRQQRSQLRKRRSAWLWSWFGEKTNNTLEFWPSWRKKNELCFWHTRDCATTATNWQIWQNEIHTHVPFLCKMSMPLNPNAWLLVDHSNGPIRCILTRNNSTPCFWECNSKIVNPPA